MSRDDEGLMLRCFILEPKSRFYGDPYAYASRQVLRAYAQGVVKRNPKLAVDLKEWADKEGENASKLAPT